MTQPLTKRLIGLVVVVVAMFIGYRWVVQRNATQRRRGTGQGTNMVGGAAGQDSIDDGKVYTSGVASKSKPQLTLAQKYLFSTDRRRRSVIVTPNSLLRNAVSMGEAPSSSSSASFPPPSSNPIQLLDDHISVLHALAANCELYIVSMYPPVTTRSHNSSSTPSQPDPVARRHREYELYMLRFLQANGMFKAGLQAQRVLFCATSIGKCAMARQIQPALFVDDDVEAAELLRPHIEDVCLIASTTPPPPPKSVATAHHPERRPYAVHPSIVHLFA